jgi:hypothetical protein
MLALWGLIMFGALTYPGGVKLFENSPILDRCIARHKKDYAALKIIAAYSCWTQGRF